MRAFGIAAVLLASLPVAVVAQPGPPEQRPVIHSALPAPGLSEDAKPSDFLRAAQGAVAAGRKGVAEQSLEMAQTRLLDRSVPLGRTQDPSKNPAIAQISQAMQALSAGDREACLRSIQAALDAVSAEGL